jgi:drug/metabolite transporter (DMT)-like permease
LSGPGQLASGGAATGHLRPIAKDNYARAVLFMLLAAVLLPVLNASIQYLVPTYSVAELLWARYAGHLGFMLIVFAPRYGLALFASSRPGLQVARSLLFCGSTFLTFYALGFVPLATAAAIFLTAPLIVTGLSPFVLGEKVRLTRALAVAAGFLGALIVVRPGSGALHWAAFLIFGSATASALTQLLSRKLAGHDSPETSNTYMVTAGFVLASMPLPFIWQAPANYWDAFLFVMLGVLGGLGHYFVVRAFELAPAPFVSPFNYAQILTAALVGFLVFGQLPDLWTWCGAGIIAASGLFILFHERRRAARATRAEP